MKRFFAPQTVGSLDQLRAELAYRRNGRQLFIPVGENGEKGLIDAMLIPHPEAVTAKDSEVQLLTNIIQILLIVEQLYLLMFT